MSASDAGPLDASPLPRTALVVMAQEDVRRRVRSALHAHGLLTLEAPDGLAAWHILTTHCDRLHLLVTDVALPGLPGGVLAALTHELWPRLPILMLSDQPSDRVAARFPSLARAFFLHLPFRPDDLAAVLRTLLPPQA